MGQTLISLLNGVFCFVLFEVKIAVVLALFINDEYRRHDHGTLPRLPLPRLFYPCNNLVRFITQCHDHASSTSVSSLSLHRCARQLMSSTSSWRGQLPNATSLYKAVEAKLWHSMRSRECIPRHITVKEWQLVMARSEH